MFDIKNLFNNKSDSSSTTTKSKLEKVKLPCASCGKVNSVEVNKLNSSPTCGSCKNSLVIIDSPVNVSNTTFDKEVLNWPGIVLVDFWATWCPPCKMIAPILESISKEKAGEIKVVKVNTEEERLLAGKYQISSIPTLILFDNGRQINQVSGAMPKEKLLNWIYSSI
ncbi:MAG: thioredoxin TrxC [Cyanobacteriota bacterium]